MGAPPLFVKPPIHVHISGCSSLSFSPDEKICVMKNCVALIVYSEASTEIGLKIGFSLCFSDAYYKCM